MKRLMFVAILAAVGLNSYAQDVHIRKDVTMTAQGVGNNVSEASFFIGKDGKAIGSCDVKANEKEVDFVAYCNNASVFVLYSPAASGGIAKNFKCNGQGWVPGSGLKDTKFRVLVPASKTNRLIYEKVASGTIDKLDDTFFAKVSEPSAGTVKYHADEANQTGNTFNTSSAYLIWARIPQGNGGYKNALLRIRSVNVATPVGKSTMVMDVIMQK